MINFPCKELIFYFIRLVEKAYLYIPQNLNDLYLMLLRDPCQVVFNFMDSVEHYYGPFGICCNRRLTRAVMHGINNGKVTQCIL